MINDQAQKLLVPQVAHELNGPPDLHGHLALLQRESLNGWAKFFHEQAVEEAGHGWKIIDFLIDNDVEFALPQVGARRRRTSPPARRSRCAQASERRVTQQFETLASAAREARDNRTPPVPPLVHRGAGRGGADDGALLDLIDSGINLFQAEAHLDSVVRE